MIIKKLSEIKPFIAGDETLLKEIINPSDKDAIVKYSLAHALVQPGQKTLPHKLKSSEIYYIISGVGKVYIDNEIEIVEANQLVYIPPLANQSIKNIGNIDLVFLCICDPAWRKEDEVLVT